MSKQSLLLVDGDPRSLRVLEVSLKKAGFNVTTAVNGRDALDKVELAPPDLVISETQLEEIDGFAFCQRLKGNPAWADIPFVFLTAQTDIATKIRGLELGVDDYLTKPIYIKEIVARARILLQKRQRTRIEERRDGRTRFSGHLSDMPIVDLIQTVEISRKSGLIQFVGEGGKQAAIYFRDGKVIDAEAGPLAAEDAVYRLLTWNEGEFEVAFRTVRRRDTITMSPQALLMEGMRRLDEWGRLCEQLPPLDTRFEIDARELASRLGDIQDEHNAILRLFDGRRSVLEVIDACDYGDLESLEVIARLYFEGVLVEAGPLKPTMSSEWMVPSAAIEAATAGMRAPATGLVSEDDELTAEERAEAGATSPRTISGEWTLDADPEAMASDTPGEAATVRADDRPASEPPASDRSRRTTTRPPLPTLPRTLTPSSRPPSTAPVPSLPVIPAPPTRRSLIQKAIDDSDAIPLAELEEQIGRELVEPPVVVSDLAAAPPASTEAQDAGAAATGEGAVPPSAGPAREEPLAAKPEGDRPVGEADGALTGSTTTAAAAVATSLERGPAGKRGTGTTEPPRRARPTPLGSATLVTDPRPPARTPVGSQRVPIERDEPGATARADEPVPPNRRGPRWPAIVVGLAVTAGLGYAVVRMARSNRRPPPAAALVLDGGLAGGAVPGLLDAASLAPVLDAGVAPVDAPAAARDASTPVDAARLVDAARPPADPATPPAPANDELKRKLDAARKLMATDPQAALDQIDVLLDEYRSTRALTLRADALQRLGRTEAALSAIGAALAMSPRNAAAWELKGRILWNAGRREDARPAYVRYLELQPTGATADEVRRRLSGT